MSKSIIISNLDIKVTEDALKSILELISPITQIKITQDKDNNVRIFFLWGYFSHSFSYSEDLSGQ
jgi:RNA recognition motif-containing protein